MIEAITLKMIQHSQGNRHDIQHFLKVWAYARTIGLAEKLNDEKQKILEIAALCHDIACPFCRQKDGRALGEDQEREGAKMIPAFLAEFDLTPGQIERIAYLVGHHHHPASIDDLDYQILIEADYLVNADEAGYELNAIVAFGKQFFRTMTGKQILKKCISRRGHNDRSDHF